jgi:hypothetical protein
MAPNLFKKAQCDNCWSILPNHLSWENPLVRLNKLLHCTNFYASKRTVATGYKSSACKTSSMFNLSLPCYMRSSVVFWVHFRPVTRKSEWYSRCTCQRNCISINITANETAYQHIRYNLLLQWNHEIPLIWAPNSHKNLKNIKWGGPWSLITLWNFTFKKSKVWCKN